MAIKSHKFNQSNLLVEIGTEELPLAALDVIYRDLKNKASVVFTQHRITFEEIRVEATPRRVALYIEGTARKQTDHTSEITGPSYEKAFDGSRNPTMALMGFLKAKGATLKDISEKETPKGSVILVTKHEKGESLQSILPAMLTEIFTTLPFMKTMRWEPSGFRFPRPIRWIAAILDDQPVNFKMAGLKAGLISYGNRFLAPKSFKLQKADWKVYLGGLKKKLVILSLEERKELIRKALKVRFKQTLLDEDLIHTTSQLVEAPFFFEGKFDKDYLDLPPEVLATCMKKNQKVFACYGPKRKLQNRFVAVMNGKRLGLERIRFDYENVLDSRLKDARYFYKADTKEALESKQPLLKQITYLGKLGTMYDKSQRLEKFSEEFAQSCGHAKMASKLKRTSQLAKIDLMTQLVFEFTELQGIVGRHYAITAGEDKEVAFAIGTQYLPASLNENYQDLTKTITPLGALYGILDRLDLLVGAFGTGIEPTGSQDPFALRRAGGVLVKLTRAFEISFPLAQVIRKNAELYGNVLDQDPTEKMLKFLAERAAFELQLKPGTREMEIFQAVWNTSHENLADVFCRYEDLKNFSGKQPEKFRQAAKVVERTANIAKQAGKLEQKIQEALLTEPLEKELYSLLEAKSAQISGCIDKEDYSKATLLFGETFYRPIHDFFEKVMVNVEDAAVRSNRQALMSRINRLYTDRLADLSVLSRLDEK